MNITIVAGTFNDEGGKASGWAKQLHSAITVYRSSIDTVSYHNGGFWNNLQNIFDTLPQSGVVLWLADVPNDKPKLIKQLKVKNPKVFLVSSKRNLENEYSVHDLVSRALEIKANLLLEFTGDRKQVQTSILDPLGNYFLVKDTDINKVSYILVDRLRTLMNIKRIGSTQVGEAIPVPKNDEVNGFLEIVKSQAEVFHNIIHGVNTTRMLGNASFRCERGFPSFKDKDMIFVSQRNVDKRFIGPEAFVAVQQGDNGVEYFGSNKPSVDTPVQLELFKCWPEVKYMLHSHTYIEGAKFTKTVLPCGAIEEVEQILEAFPHFDMKNFCVNIKGHGSICFADNLDYFKFVNWIPRPTPEIVECSNYYLDTNI